MNPTLRAMRKRLIDAALAYPGAYEDHPWGETVVKVGKSKGKVFVFCGLDEAGDTLHLTAKLPNTGAMALGLPFAKPTGYNLGKSGWVSASFTDPDEVPEPMLLEWIDESYRAVAPKKLIAERDGEPPQVGARVPARSSRKKTKKKTSAAKSATSAKKRKTKR